MASGQKSYTTAGNVHAPSKAQCLKWVKECWSSLSTELTQKSFRSCGISANVDSSEDAQIYCLKAGVKLLLLAAPAITNFTCKLLQEDEGDKEDLFASVDEEDEGELEQNKLQSNLDYPNFDYPNTSIIRTLRLGPMNKFILNE